MHRYLLLFSVDYLFFCMNTIGFIGFFELALKWPELMNAWAKAELKLSLFCNHSLGKSYTFKIRFVASTVLLLALGIKFEIFCNC